MHQASGAIIPRALSIGLVLTTQIGCGDVPQDSSARASALIGQQPVNPNASAKTRAVFDLLNELPYRSDNKVISGQVLHPLNWTPEGSEYVPEPGHLAPYYAPCDRVDDIHAQTGYWVGISSSEYTDWEQSFYSPGAQRMVDGLVNPCFVAHNQRGGIVSPHFHPMNPKDGTYFPSDPGAQGPVTAAEILGPGPIHDNWMAILDRAALGLLELKNNDVVVLWRPMHARDAGWWWGYPNMSKEDYRAIWAHMVDYFSNTWGLDNILYVQSWYFLDYDPGKLDQIYAGSNNVDIVAVDHAGEYNAAGWGLERANLLSFGKPYGITQVDCFGCDTRSTIIDHIKYQWPETTFFIGFDHPLYPTDGLGYGQNTQALLADPWVLNAGELFGGCTPQCDGLSCGASDGCGGTCGNACDSGCGHCSNSTMDCDESGVDCGGSECGECTSSYSCPDGTLCDGSPVTGSPDEQICGTDLILWTCTPSGWQSTGNDCTCPSTSCPGPCQDGYVWGADCQCYPCWDWCSFCASNYDPDCEAATASRGC